MFGGGVGPGQGEGMRVTRHSQLELQHLDKLFESRIWVYLVLFCIFHAESGPWHIIGA